MAIEFNKNISLYLAGGGNESQSQIFDASWIDAIGNRIKQTPTASQILYLPQALDQTRFQKAEKWFMKSYQNQLLKLGCQPRLVSDLNTMKEHRSETIASVYIGGGNTQNLLEQLRAYSVDQLLIDWLNSGVIIYGGSAGAIIWGSDISTAPEVPQYTPGINVFSRPTFIACHYQIDDNEHNRLLALSQQGDVFAIPEDAGLMFNGQGLLVIGRSPAINIQNGQIRPLEPNQRYDF